MTSPSNLSRIQLVCASEKLIQALSCNDDHHIAPSDRDDLTPQVATEVPEAVSLPNCPTTNETLPNHDDGFTKRHDQVALNGRPPERSSSEQTELHRLQQELRRVQSERDFWAQTAARFAQLYADHAGRV